MLFKPGIDAHLRNISCDHLCSDFENAFNFDYMHLSFEQMLISEEKKRITENNIIKKSPAKSNDYVSRSLRQRLIQVIRLIHVMQLLNSVIIMN